MFENRYINLHSFNYNMTFGGNQIVGIELCRAAQKHFNEETKEGWN